jgi:hypothetical protein
MTAKALLGFLHQEPKLLITEFTAVVVHIALQMI